MTGGRSTVGPVHWAAVYDSDAELVETVVPFLDGDATPGDLLLLAAGSRVASVILPQLPAGVPVTHLQNAYQRPATTVRQFQDLVYGRYRAGAGRVRVVGEIPQEVRRDAWWPWARYEAAANTLFTGGSFSGLCLYDARSTPPAVLDDVAATHQTLLLGGGPRPSHGYLDPATFLARREVPDPDPLQSGPAALELRDPSPARARAEARRLAHDRSVDADRLDALVYGLSEAVTNAQQHGRPPVTVYVWAGAGRLVAAIHDTGPGPADPYAGLVKAHPGDETSGYGLWAIHQMCDQAVHYTDRTGFTIRLTA